MKTKYDLNDPKILGKFEQKTKEMIKNSIKDFASYKKPRTIKEIQGTEHEWVGELAKDILSTAEVFKLYNSILSGDYASEFSVNAKQNMDSSDGLSMTLSIESNNEQKQKNLAALLYGGEIKTDQKSIIVDKTNIRFTQDDAQRAADKLRDYFIQKISADLEKEHD